MLRGMFAAVVFAALLVPMTSAAQSTPYTVDIDPSRWTAFSPGCGEQLPSDPNRSLQPLNALRLFPPGSCWDSQPGVSVSVPAGLTSPPVLTVRLAVVPEQNVSNAQLEIGATLFEAGGSMLSSACTHDGGWYGNKITVSVTGSAGQVIWVEKQIPWLCSGVPALPALVRVVVVRHFQDTTGVNLNLIGGFVTLW